MVDEQLAVLLAARRRLLDELAPVLRRVGATHPKRAVINAKRAAQRKRTKKALRANAEAIAARLSLLYPPAT